MLHLFYQRILGCYKNNINRKQRPNPQPMDRMIISAQARHRNMYGQHSEYCPYGLIIIYSNICCPIVRNYFSNFAFAFSN